MAQIKSESDITMKLRFLAGVGIGYVLGARAGRERYEQILGTVRDLTDSDLARQIKDTAGNIGGGGASSSGDVDSSGLVTTPVIVGPGPDGQTGTKAGDDLVLPDLEPSTSGSIDGDTPAAADTNGKAKRLDPSTG